MPNRRLNVFLCHAKEDKPTVRELYRKLVAEGWLEVWLDEENLFPGQEWDMEIEKAVEQADVVVTCLSTHSVDKEGYVQKELRFVLNIADEKPEGTLFVIPLRLDECVVPRRLRSWQYADYFPKEERARAYQRLLHSLRMRAGRLGIPTVNPAEQARKEAEEKARQEREEQERKAAEDRARLEAEEKAREEKEDQERKVVQDRARLEAEEKARKEKEEKDRQAAQEKARLQAERKAKREREAKAVGQIANLTPAPEKTSDSPAGVRVGGNVGDSTIVTGDQNVIIQVAPPALEQVKTPPSSRVSSRLPATPKKTTSKPDLRLWIVLGGLFAIILCGLGLNYLIQNWPDSPAPTSTPTFTLTLRPPTQTRAPTLRPPTEMPTITLTPEPGVGDTWTSPKDGMTMFYIPAGDFSMGSDNGSDDEKPVHDVTLDSFWIDQTEVTNEMFAKFVNETSHETDAEKSGSSYVYQNGSWENVNGADWNHPRGPSSTISGIEDHPVVHVSWNDAKAYCEWRGDGTRLPTEAEWEKAASWDDTKKEKRVYPWGDAFNGSLLNFCDKNCPFSWADKTVDDGYEFTAPVGSYPGGASFYGLLDMAGNVWEWVADWYDAYPGNTVSNSDYGTQYRVLRGGAGVVGGVRSSVRVRGSPDVTYNFIGFRCARSLP